MADNLVPSMSDRGWIASAPEKADSMMSHFFEADVEQTYLYPDGIANLQGLLQKYGNEMNTFCAQLQSALQLYFGRYFDKASVNVTSDADTSPSNVVIVKVSCIVTQANRDFPLEDLIQLSEGKFKRLVRLNAFGE